MESHDQGPTDVAAQDGVDGVDGADAREPATGSAVAPGFRDEPGSSHAGAVRSFDEFYRAELPGLVTLARGLCPAGIAEDVAQEAMLVVMRRWPEVSRYDHPEAWVRRTCANLAVSHFRRKVIELRAARRLGSRPQPAPPEPVGDGFWPVVRELPRRQAQAVALHYLLDLSVAEVAAPLGLWEGGVMVHLRRARETLRRTLQPHAEQPDPHHQQDEQPREARS
jgi:RNA polymerase sigma-70 factor (ECF subfamily)